MQFSQDFFIRLVAFFSLFLIVSLAIFWVGIVWWVSQDVLARSKDKIIVAASVAISAILGPVGVLLYLVIRPKQTIQEANIEVMEREMLLHASATTICPHCNRMAQQDFLACPYCGTQLKYHCRSCDKLVDMDWQHCPYCGTSTRHEQQALDAAVLEQLSQSDSAQYLAQPSIAQKDRPKRESAIKKMGVSLWQGLNHLARAIANGIIWLLSSLAGLSKGAALSATASGRKIAVATSRAVTNAQTNVKKRSNQPRSYEDQHQADTETIEPKSSTSSMKFASPANFSSANSAEKPSLKKKPNDITKVVHELKQKKVTRHRA
jgi:RNA polymerase subunit RPABC4/transcription elongation factor Spt4